MQKVSSCLKIIGTIFTLFVIISLTGIYYACDWLLIESKPEKSDYAIVLAGDPRRAIHAAELYHTKLVDKILISRPARVGYQTTLDEMNIFFPKQEQLSYELLIKHQIPPEKIEFFGQHSISTVQEASELSRLNETKPFSFIIVTSPYHVRRSRMIFQDFLPDTKFSVIGNKYEPFPKEWWKSQTLASKLVLEVTKIIYYQFGGHFFHKQPTK